MWHSLLYHTISWSKWLVFYSKKNPDMKKKPEHLRITGGDQLSTWLASQEDQRLRTDKVVNEYTDRQSVNFPALHCSTDTGRGDFTVHLVNYFIYHVLAIIVYCKSRVCRSTTVRNWGSSYFELFTLALIYYFGQQISCRKKRRGKRHS